VVFANDSEKMDYIANEAWRCCPTSLPNAIFRYIPDEVIWNSFKHTYMAEDASAKEDKAGENIAFYLPDGSYIKTETHSGDVNAHESDERNWDALDVYLIDRDGKKDLLCSVDYEDQKGLRVLVYDEESEEPVYKHPADIGTECKKAGQVAPEKISVDTLFGKLEACVGGNPEDYPTIFTYIVRPDGAEIDLVSCEVKWEEEIAQAYLYGDPETMDWTKSHQWTKDAILGPSEETNAEENPEANNVVESADTSIPDDSAEVCPDDKEQNLQVVKDMVKSCQEALKKLAYGNDYEVSSRADEIFSLTIDELELLIKKAGR